MNVPILRIPFDDRELDAISRDIREVLLSGMLTMGRFTEKFEAEFARFGDAPYAVAVANGTCALEIIVRALGIEGRSIIVPTNTFLATAFAVMHSGNRVVFADSDPETLCLDVGDVKRRLEPDTAAVVMVHIGGIISPAIHELAALCQERGIQLIEDCAHAHGSRLGGQPAGSFGVAGAFSFFPTKVLTTGEGGIIVTRDKALAERARMLRNHGKNPDLGNKMSEFGYNWRLSELTAVVGVHQMAKAEALLAARHQIAAFYDARLATLKGIRPLRLAPEVQSSYYKYIAYLDAGVDRGRLRRRLKEEHGVALTGGVYDDLCHREPVWKNVTYCGATRTPAGAAAPRGPECRRYPGCGCDGVQDGFPGAEHVSQRHVCLPIYPGLSEAELEHVVTSLAKSLSSNGSR